jgi:uncharacterized protein YegP (UPF0339 family)
VKHSRFVVYQDRAGLWRWRLLAANNRIIADSGEGYASKANALRAVKRVIYHAARAA